MGQNCVFCKILAKEIPAKVIYEDGDVLGIMDINPVAQVHYLFFPKKHVESLAHLEPTEFEIISKINKAAVAVAAREGFKEKGFRTIVNTGKGGGQTVFHLHLHLLSGGRLKAEIN